jgi:hypothetical protein
MERKMGGGAKEKFVDYVWVLDPIDGTKSFITGIFLYIFEIFSPLRLSFSKYTQIILNLYLPQENPCLVPSLHCYTGVNQ